MSNPTERRQVGPCWPEDSVGHAEGGGGGLGSGRPSTMSGYSRAGIAAEAGIAPASVRKAVNGGRLDERSPYDVARYVAQQRATELGEMFPDLDIAAGLELLEALETFSRARVGEAELLAFRGRS